MNRVIFYVIYPIIWLLSILPMPILYGIADILFFLHFYIFGYRKKVVLKNIAIAFPEKDVKEQEAIAKKFNKNFIDLLVESIKSFTISEKEILKRYQYKNPELVNKYAQEGKSIALVSAHLANWEWSTSLGLVLGTNVFGAYSRIRNDIFENKVKETRQKFGIKGATTSNFINLINSNFKNNIQGAYILLSDQSPRLSKAYYWTLFFGTKVPVHTGAEMLSKKHNMVVINYRSKKIKRGYYEVDFELITETPNLYKDYEVTDQFLKITERNIREQPECYLWTHKRFKHHDRYKDWQKIMLEKQKEKKI
ncbi:lipid A biosynthesis acyltransferase [uncultured Polaribacter sp.]|uniref:lysophospholipid acyltransferase family protein n=1 Tax=uncultured Polaribacter sp. TaxID=174711 RepID=UPI002609FF1D|nr:lipid A biosynthesis acyltransferase [uncultured Polaribacter sp.]